MSSTEIDLTFQDGLPDDEEQDERGPEFDWDQFGVGRSGGGASGSSCNSSGSGGSSCGSCDTGR